MTGIGSGECLKLDLGEASERVVEENVRVAAAIGINSATRTTCIKPSGTSSLVLGSASGIHAWHSPYYIRRSRVGKDEALYRFLIREAPELVEDDQEKPHLQAVIEIPIKAPEGSLYRDESYLSLLERVRMFNLEWVRPGSLSGQNTNNVSCTISLKEDEWEGCGEWMWKNRGVFNGISVLPYDGGSYVQAPFEEIDEERYLLLTNSLKEIDLTQVIEDKDNTDLSGELACGLGGCEIG